MRSPEATASRPWYHVALLICIVALTPPAPASPMPDAARRFGARETIDAMQLSPDGSRVAYISPLKGQGAALLVQPVDATAKPALVVALDGDPERLGHCRWVSNLRLACQVFGVVRSRDGNGEIYPFTRMFAIDADGGNMRILSIRQSGDARGLALGGGTIIDWLPEADGQVLMQRVYLADDRTGSRMGSRDEGLGVDKVDTVTLRSSRLEAPRPDTVGFLSDGRGNVRIMVVNRMAGATGMQSAVLAYLHRPGEGHVWEQLSDYDVQSRDGFRPVAVDSDLNVAYGFRKRDGRMALFRKTLDGSGAEELLLARPDVDVDALVRVGRRQRVVGASFATDRRTTVYFDAELAALARQLGRSLPGQPDLYIVDSSLDERKLLLWAGADNDPGVYYVFDRDRRELKTFLVSRPLLEGVPLASVKPVNYPAADGTMVPGYLTLPPGPQARKLPAIVLPHGGPSARDEWGFDWLAQYFAHMGFAVIQPNFRGSAGYGDAWFQDNGFRSWKTAIGDVTDAGRWLVREGIADPTRLAILGWSYGGYAALQSAIVDPGLFKAVVAVAPVTDLPLLKEEARNWTDYRIQADFIGAGPHLEEGSPARQADRLAAPVLLIHGDLDRNVNIDQSTRMAARLAAAGKPHRLIRFDGLDHYLEDSAARERLLSESLAFLREAFGEGSLGATE